MSSPVCENKVCDIKFESELNLTFVYPCIASIIVNDDQQDATILVYDMDEMEWSSISSMTPAGSNIGGQYQKL